VKSIVISFSRGLSLLSQVPITFLPRDRGDYAQFWDLECHPVSEPQQKTRIRFQLCGTVRTRSADTRLSACLFSGVFTNLLVLKGVKSGPVEGPQEGDCSLVKTEATVKTRKRVDASAGKTRWDLFLLSSGPVFKRGCVSSSRAGYLLAVWTHFLSFSQEEVARRGVYAPQELYTFPATRTGEARTLKVNIRNNSADTHEVRPREDTLASSLKCSICIFVYMYINVYL